MTVPIIGKFTIIKVLYGVSDLYLKHYLMLCFLLLSSVVNAVNTDQWLIQEIQLEDGLPDATVFSIQQDKSGFMWFGTTNGIARFDGYAFKVFQHEGSDPQSLSNNNAGNLFIDSNNILWIGTFGGGVNTLNLNNGLLKRFPYSNNKFDEMVSANVQTFFEDSRSNVWVGTATGLFQLIDDKLIHFNHEESIDKGLIDSRVWDIQEGKTGHLWIGTSEGLIELNTKTEEVKTFHLPDELVVNISSNQFRTMNLVGDRLWIGSATGLYEFDLTTHEFTPHTSDNAIKINDIYLIDSENFLIASMDGLLRFNLLKQKYVNNSGGEVWRSQVSTDIRKIYVDESQVLWLATRDNGVIKIDQSGGLFKHHKNYSAKQHTSDENRQVWALEFDTQDQFYLGSSDNLFKKGNNKNFDTIAVANAQSDAQSGAQSVPGIIRDLKLAQDKGMWIAGSEGLFYLKENQTVAQKVNAPFDLVGIHPTDIFSIEETSSGEIWLTLYNVGVLRWNPRTSEAQLIQDFSGGSLTDLNLTHIFQDNNENIWIASYITGVFKYNPKIDKMVLYSHDYNDISSLSSNRVRQVYQDSQDRIWIATARGLNLFDEQNNGFKHYLQSDGMLENSVLSIIEDSKQNLWVVYKFGISKFNSSLEKVSNFLISQSIQLDGLTTRAVAIDESDKLYFGSIKGYYTFDPNKIANKADYVPLLSLTNVTINNNPLTFAELSSHSLHYDLFHDDRVIALDFAVLDYKNQEQIQYSYRMVGYQNNWQDVSVTRTVNLSHLKSGHYTLELKAKNNNDQWSTKTLKIELIVHPIWWDIAWVRILFAIVVLLFAVFLHRYRTYKIRKHNFELETKVKNRTSELLSLNQQLKVASQTNYLTGLYNRSGFIHHYKAKKITSIASCLVLADLDNFKRINDKYGHTAGDEVLKNTAAIMSAAIDKEVLLARWGGEEFVFYFEGKSTTQTLEKIELIRKKIQNSSIEYKGEIISTTCTFGLSQWRHGQNLIDLINAADKAMYVGKSKGRNTTVISTS